MGTDTILIHDEIVSEVMSEICADYFPGVTFLFDDVLDEALTENEIDNALNVLEG